MRKFRTIREFYDRHRADSQLWCSNWPPNTYFLVVFTGKRYCIGTCHKDGFDGQEFWFDLDAYSPDIYYQLYKPKKKRPK